MERDNFFILLELPFDPPESDGEVIQETLRKKKQEWTRLQDNPARRAQALRNLGLVPEIEAVMLDSAKRREEAAQAVKLREDMLRRFEAELRLLEGKGHVLPQEAAAIVLRYKAYGVTRGLLEERLSVPIAHESAEEEGQTEEVRALDRSMADNIQRLLSALGYPDVYAFLGEEPYASLKKLTDAADRRRREAAVGGKNASSALEQELAGICTSLFGSFDSKQSYDQLRKISLYPEINRLVEEEFARSKYISPTALVRLVNFGVESYNGKVLELEDYIRRYCAAREYPVDTQSILIHCPSCHNSTRRDGGACTICGAPLKGECPGCATPFSDGISACGECGFPVAKMGKALRYIAEAESALIENNWSTAERALQYARQFWPGHPLIELLERRSRQLEERYGRYVESIRDCIELGRYYAAQELIWEAQGKRIRLPGATISHVEKVIADLEEALEQLRRREQKDKEPSFSVLSKLASKVADSLDLNRMLAEFPPDPPQEVAARIVGRQIHLAWSPSPSVGAVSYVVVRKTGSRPLTAFDGEVVYEGAAITTVDRTAPPMLEHFYSVYARRGLSCSVTGCDARPLRVVPPIENLRIIPADMGAQLTWDFNPDIREVQIWRKLSGERPTAPGDGIRLDTDRLDGYSDTKIKNDVEYWYYLVATYVVDGQHIASKGVCDSVIPHQIIAPIEDLDIARVDGSDNEYVVNWHDGWKSAETDVILLSSIKPPACRVGEILPVAELMERFRRVDLDVRQGNGARFRRRFNGGLYIFAAVVYGKFATVGRPYYLINLTPPRDVTYDLVGRDLYVNLKWPTGVDQVALAYRFDKFPAHPDDPSASALLCTREQYDYDAGVMLKEPERAVYYARVYSVFTTPSGERAYSQGVDLMIDNAARQEILYGVRYSKPPLSHSGKLTLTLQTDGSFRLPPIALVGKIGRLPLRQTDGMPLVTLEKETAIQDAVTIEYRTDPLPEDLYLRVFLREEERYDKIRLLATADMKLT